MTRLQTYTETIKLTKTSEREYSAELDFKSGGAQPLYTRMMTVGIASLVPHKAPESAVPRLKEGPDPFGEFDNAQFIEIGKQHIAKMEGAFERWQGQRDMPIRDSLGIDLYKSKGKPFFEFC